MVGHGNRIIVRFSVVARPLQQAERRGVATHRHNSPDDLRTYKYRSSFFSFFPFFSSGPRKLWLLFDGSQRSKGTRRPYEDAISPRYDGPRILVRCVGWDSHWLPHCHGVYRNAVPLSTVHTSITGILISATVQYHQHRYSLVLYQPTHPLLHYTHPFSAGKPVFMAKFF